MSVLRMVFLNAWVMLPFVSLSASAAPSSNPATSVSVASNLITFHVETSKEVSNDEANATLSKTLQAKTAKDLARQINPIINQSLALAKKYPSVQVSTGSQYGHPRYDSKGKIIGFEGTASLNLKSKNSEELASLINELQTNLVLDNLYFQVSKELSEQTHSALKAEATTKFQKEAKELVKLWNAKDYRLVQADMNTNGSYAPKFYALSKVGDAVAEAAAVAAPQDLQGGNSQLSYQINGTIQLIF